MQKSVTRPRVVPPRIVPPRAVPAPGPGPGPAELSAAGSSPAGLSADAPRATRTVRRIAAGALMTAVIVGGTAGATVAASRDLPDSAPAVVRPSEVTTTPSANRVQNAVFSEGTTVFTWPTPSSTKSTPVRTSDPDQGVVRRTGTATRIAAIWAIAATVATAGILAGSLLGRREA